MSKSLVVTVALGVAIAWGGSTLPAQHLEPAAMTEYEKGFALVYRQADALTGIDLLLVVKAEDEVVGEVTRAVAELAAVIVETLEARARADGSIVLDLEFLPEVEAGARRRMGLGIGDDVLLSFGCDFERNLLFAESVAVLRLLSLSEEMIAQAPDDEHRALWRSITGRVRPVFDRIRALDAHCAQGERPASP